MHLALVHRPHRKEIQQAAGDMRLVGGLQVEHHGVRFSRRWSAISLAFSKRSGGERRPAPPGSPRMLGGVVEMND